MPRRYTIISRPVLLRDEASVRRHLEDDDYFGTIATILSLIKEQLAKDPQKNIQTIIFLLEEIQRDLTALQASCRISYRPQAQSKPSTKNKNSTPKGRLISQ